MNAYQRKRVVVKSQKLINIAIPVILIYIGIIATANFTKTDKITEKQNETDKELIKLQTDYNFCKYFLYQDNERQNKDILYIKPKTIEHSNIISYICRKLKINNYENNNRN